jgi:hypothetical protein
MAPGQTACTRMEGCSSTFLAPVRNARVHGGPLRARRPGHDRRGALRLAPQADPRRPAPPPRRLASRQRALPASARARAAGDPEARLASATPPPSRDSSQKARACAARCSRREERSSSPRRRRSSASWPRSACPRVSAWSRTFSRACRTPEPPAALLSRRAATALRWSASRRALMYTRDHAELLRPRSQETGDPMRIV